MPRYRATAEYTSYLDVYFDAENEEEAWSIAKDMDGAEFWEIEDGNWRIDSIEKA